MLANSTMIGAWLLERFPFLSSASHWVETNLSSFAFLAGIDTGDILNVRMLASDTSRHRMPILRKRLPGVPLVARPAPM